MFGWVLELVLAPLLFVAKAAALEVALPTLVVDQRIAEVGKLVVVASHTAYPERMLDRTVAGSKLGLTYLLILIIKHSQFVTFYFNRSGL